MELRRLVAPAGIILLVGYHTFTVKNGLPFCKGGSSGSRKPPSFFLDRIHVLFFGENSLPLGAADI